jgi:tetratricopeptide (TPR) repeat protein
MVAFAHSATGLVETDGRMRLPPGVPTAAVFIGENELRRRIGLLGAPEPVARTLAAADLERLGNLTPQQLACLALFDAIEPVDGKYSYRDTVAAREAGRLLARGVALRRILEAAIALKRRGGDLAEGKLTESASGGLVREFQGQIAELNGQLAMRLDQETRSVDELVAAAEQAEENGDFPVAESLYATALRADANDPVLAFNLGNVFEASGRPAEAKVAWQIAVARDPAFAEAWYNLAMAAEDEQQSDLAIAQYRRAMQARPDFGDAHFNLALLLTKLDRCAEALVLWERFVELEPHSKQTALAKRAATLCRMQMQQQRGSTPHASTSSA